MSIFQRKYDLPLMACSYFRSLLSSQYTTLGYPCKQGNRRTFCTLLVGGPAPNPLECRASSAVVKNSCGILRLSLRPKTKRNPMAITLICVHSHRALFYLSFPVVCCSCSGSASRIRWVCPSSNRSSSRRVSIFDLMCRRFLSSSFRCDSCSPACFF